LIATDPWIGVSPRKLIEPMRYLLNATGVALPRNPSDEDLRELVRVWGNAKEFEKNSPAIAEALKLEGNAEAIPGKRMLKAMKATGLLDRFGIRTIHGPAKPSQRVVVMLRGSIANWTQKAVEEFLFHVSNGNISVATVVMLAGNRPCGQPTELTNEFVQSYMSSHKGRIPTEEELLLWIFREKTGHKSRLHFGSLNREDQVRAHFEARPSLAQGLIYVPGNAPSLVGDGLQIRRIIRVIFPNFDQNGDQYYVSQQGGLLAETPQQARNAFKYQRPLTFFSALARAYRELVLLNRLEANA
jgi:hypothetical protein